VNGVAKETLEAGEAEVAEPRRKLVRWNELDGPLSTLRFGAGLLYEAVHKVGSPQAGDPWFHVGATHFFQSRIQLVFRMR
jgi:hypothetical protein